MGCGASATPANGENAKGSASANAEAAAKTEPVTKADAPAKDREGLRVGSAPDKFGGCTPFIMIARVKVKQGKAKEYLELATTVDKAVMDSELGMLHHTWDLDPADPTGHSFVWTEMFADSASFVKHIENGSAYSTKHGELGESFSAEFYGTIDTKANSVSDSTGVPATYYKTQLGFSRSSPNTASAVSAVGATPDKFGGSTPCLMIARVKVKEGKANEYLELARAVDNAVMNSEPGMLHHTWDLDPADSTGHSFVWTEMYADSASFVKHIQNGSLYFARHGELGESFSAEFYGTIDAEAKKVSDSTGVLVTYYETQLGFSRLQAKAATPQPDGQPVELKISDLSGPCHTIKANTAWTVTTLKDVIYIASGIPPIEQELLQGGDDLDDSESLGGPRLKGNIDYQLMDKRMMKK